MLSLGNSRLISLGLRRGYRLMKQRDTFAGRRNNSSPWSLSPTHEHTSHVRSPHILYIFYLKSLKLSTHQCFSLEFHFRNANALGPDTQWFISLFIFAHICPCPCVCLLLIPPFFQPACLPWDLGLPHLPLSAPNAHACVHAYTPTTSTCRQTVRIFSCAHYCSAR